MLRRRHFWLANRPAIVGEWSTARPIPNLGAVGTCRTDGTVFAVMAVDIVDGRVTATRSMRTPEKLGHLVREPADDLRGQASAVPRSRSLIDELLAERRRDAADE